MFGVYPVILLSGAKHAFATSCSTSLPSSFAQSGVEICRAVAQNTRKCQTRVQVKVLTDEGFEARIATSVDLTSAVLCALRGNLSTRLHKRLETSIREIRRLSSV